MLGGQVLGLCPVVVDVVELPHVIVERRQGGPEQPRDAVSSDRHPPLVVDATVARHLEVLGLSTVCRMSTIDEVSQSGRALASGFTIRFPGLGRPPLHTGQRPLFAELPGG